MARSFAFWNRKLHRHGSILVALPLLVVIGSGVLLLLKKEIDWIQPPTQRGVGGEPSLSFDDILSVAGAVPEAGIKSWDDVVRLDVRPQRGVVKVRAHSGVEVQIDVTTGDLLQVMRRRSDLIESVHDGTWFHDHVKLWILLPSAVILLFLWFTGLYLWIKPHVVKRR